MTDSSSKMFSGSIQKQISREQARKLLPKTCDPHESRFETKDISKELMYKYQTQGNVTMIYDKDCTTSTEVSDTIKRKDAERGKYNKYMLVYDPNYSYVSQLYSSFYR